MTIDINDLREKITIKGLDVVADTDILEILDRLEATEEDRSTFILEMGNLCAQCDALRLRIKAAEKERDALRAAVRHEADCVEAAKAEIDALRAKIEQMERQEPVAAQHRFRHPQKTMPNWSTWQPCAISNRPAWEIDWQGYEVEYRKLYALPGAKGEEK